MMGSLKSVYVAVGVVLLVLAIVPILPATITFGLLYLFNDLNSPEIFGQMRDIGVGVSSLLLSGVVSAFAIAKACGWALVLSSALLILGYGLLVPFRDIIWVILSGS